MSPRLRAYIALEHEMLKLDAIGDPAADALRDAMDPLWLGLTEDEHAFLDGRPMGVLPTDVPQSLGVVIHNAVWITPQRAPGLVA